MPSVNAEAGPSSSTSRKRQRSTTVQDGNDDGDDSEARPSTQRGSTSKSRRQRDSDASQQSQSFTQIRYNPHGDVDKTRELRKGYRQLLEEVKESRNNMAEQRPADLAKLLQESTELFQKVEKPAESVLDSRLLLSASEMGAAMAKGMKIGSSFDVEDFLQRVATFVGGKFRSSNDADDELDYEDAEELHDPARWHWNRLGRLAVKQSKRAVTMDHLLGPLEVTHSKRSHKPRQRDSTPEAVKRPTNLRAEDIVDTTNETSKLLKEVYMQLQRAGGSEGINYFRFVLDPHSFSNSVENMFYVSFLIRDGSASLETDNDADEPILMSCEVPTEEDYAQGVARRQIIMEFDMYTWRELVRLYDIRKPTIHLKAREVAQTAQTDTWTATAPRG